MVKRKTGTGQKVQDVRRGRCYDCQNAYLMRSSKYNPIVAECSCDGQRRVASTEPPCGKFSMRTGDPVVHPMIFLNK
jgi:hypothetical protein